MSNRRTKTRDSNISLSDMEEGYQSQEMIDFSPHTNCIDTEEQDAFNRTNKPLIDEPDSVVALSSSSSTNEKYCNAVLNHYKLSTGNDFLCKDVEHNNNLYFDMICLNPNVYIIPECHPYTSILLDPTAFDTSDFELFETKSIKIENTQLVIIDSNLVHAVVDFTFRTLLDNKFLALSNDDSHN